MVERLAMYSAFHQGRRLRLAYQQSDFRRQKFLAAASGVNESSLSDMMRGRTRVSPKAALRLAACLSEHGAPCTAGYLLFGEPVECPACGRALARAPL